MRLIPQSAFSRVLWGLGLGIFCGVFFGEPAGKLEIVGQAYIRLLQITVLPYILVSLIVGLGRLDADIARRIGAVGGMLILLIWGVAFSESRFTNSLARGVAIEFVSDHRAEFAVQRMCRTLGVSTSGYYSVRHDDGPIRAIATALRGFRTVCRIRRQQRASTTRQVRARHLPAKDPARFPAVHR